MSKEQQWNTHLLAHQLSNGLQVVGEYTPDAVSVSLGFFVRTGSRDEPDEASSGISHFLEHMVFKGTRTLGWQQLKQEFTRIGAKKNGYTGLEWTYYYLHMLPEYLEQAVGLLSDMMTPRLDRNDFEQEKGVILNEIARDRDNPSVYARRKMLHAHFGTHPLGNPILGTPERIRVMSLEQMRNYWQRCYVANNLICSIVGNFDWQTFIAWLETCCGTWPIAPVGRILTPYEPAQSQQVVFTRPQLKQQTLLLSMPMVATNDPDYHVAQLAASILGHSEGSRLFWTLHHTGLAQSATSWLWTFQETGMLILQVLTSPEKAAHVLTVMRTELVNLLENGITEEELTRAKNKRVSAMVFSSESVYNRMYWIATDWMFLGRVSSIEEDIARVEQVTCADVIRVLQRFPLLDKQVLTAFGPLDEKTLLGSK